MFANMAMWTPRDNTVYRSVMTPRTPIRNQSIVRETAAVHMVGPKDPVDYRASQ
jgi:hypothetical protein